MDGRRSLDPRTRELLRRRLGAGSPALPFAEAVTLQLAHPLGGAAERGEVQTAEWVVALLDRCARPGRGSGEDARGIAVDPPALAALFQNIDLLYAERYPHADAMSRLVLDALARADG